MRNSKLELGGLGSGFSNVGVQGLEVFALGVYVLVPRPLSPVKCSSHNLPGRPRRIQQARDVLFGEFRTAELIWV